MRRREKGFQVGDLVMVYLRKEIFPVKNYKKLKLKKIGPCKIVRKFPSNVYEVKLPTRIGISPIFNVSDLYLYREPEDESQGDAIVEEKPTINWEEKMPKAEKREFKAILEKRV